MRAVSARSPFLLAQLRLDCKALTCKHVGSFSLSLTLIDASMPGTTAAAIAIELSPWLLLEKVIRCYEGSLAIYEASVASLLANRVFGNGQSG